MPTIELWLFTVMDPLTGKRRRTSYRLTVEEARARYVDPEPVPGSLERREVNEQARGHGHAIGAPTRSEDLQPRRRSRFKPERYDAALEAVCTRWTPADIVMQAAENGLYRLIFANDDGRDTGIDVDNPEALIAVLAEWWNELTPAYALVA